MDNITKVEFKTEKITFYEARISRKYYGTWKFYTSDNLKEIEILINDFLKSNEYSLDHLIKVEREQISIN
jgi:hypothetical protein